VKDSPGTWLVAIIFAAWGGGVAYLQKVLRGRRFAWWRFVAEIATSAFAGLLTFIFLREANWSVELAAACSGIAGHMGSSAIGLLEGAFTAAIRSLGERR
jgi:hypothetical protein